MFVSKELEEEIKNVFGEDDAAYQLLIRQDEEDILAYFKAVAKESKEELDKLSEQSNKCLAKLEIAEKVKKQILEQQKNDELQNPVKYNDIDKW